MREETETPEPERDVLASLWAEEDQFLSPTKVRERLEALTERLEEVERARAIVRELYDALRRYETEADAEAEVPPKHRAMMARAEAYLMGTPPEPSELRVEITDEAVEAACEAWFFDWDTYPGKSGDREAMRRSLTAALPHLTSPSEPEGEDVILRLEGRYTGVRYGNAAIPEAMTAREIFDRIRAFDAPETGDEDAKILSKPNLKRNLMKNEMQDLDGKLIPKRAEELIRDLQRRVTALELREEDTPSNKGPWILGKERQSGAIEILEVGAGAKGGVGLVAVFECEEDAKEVIKLREENHG